MPYARLLGAQIAIGAAAIFARYALTGAGPLAVAALRLALAAAVVVCVARRLRPLSPRRELAFVLAGLALAAHFATWIASLSYTSVAIATLLVTTTPLWTEIYECIHARRAPSLAFAGALGCAFAGAALVVSQRAASRPPIPGHELFGEALALGGSFAIGAYFLLVRHANGATQPERLKTRAIVARTYTWSALALVTCAAIEHQRPPAADNASAWLGIVAMALVSQLLGHTALNAALADFRPSVVALSTLCEPVVAALLAAAFFGERIGMTTVAGGGLVLLAVGITLAQTSPERDDPIPAEL